jgi:hypothetical protein
MKTNYFGYPVGYVTNFMEIVLRFKMSNVTIFSIMLNIGKWNLLCLNQQSGEGNSNLSNSFKENSVSLATQR